MKTPVRLLAALAALAALLLVPVSCRDLFRPDRDLPGTLLISLDAPFPAATRSGTTVPDVGGFQLKISSSSGQILYEGPYDHTPDELSVPAGSYTVSAVSGPFDAPAFDTPQWGDTQVVSVAPGASVSVALACSQLNSGLRLDIGESFRQAFPEGILQFKAAEGSLACTYSETRTAYFRPGAVSLQLDDGGYVQTLFTRTLEARQVLTVRLGANIETKSGSISIQVDTARTWLSEDFVLGDPGGRDVGNAYDVATARVRAADNEKGVWVWGYIVGVATGTGKVSFTPPFSKNTNLVLGTRAGTSETAYCLAVELKAGELRDALNLADHPELLGHRIHIQGDLVSAYYGIPGLKAPTGYQLD